ncbi:MAG: hypothetical protein AAF840_11500, partial [Bacteroidota bacterium]
TLDYLIKQQEDKQLWWGGSLTYQALIDFEGVANFPWATLYGDLGVKLRRDFTIGERLTLQGEVSVPIVGLVTRQPFNYIPRRQGEEPGVASLLALGTEVVTLNKYQRFNLSLSTPLPIGKRWLLRQSYNFHWFRYAEPKPISLYHHQLIFGLYYQL